MRKIFEQIMRNKFLILLENLFLHNFILIHYGVCPAPILNSTFNSYDSTKLGPSTHAV